MTIAEGLKALAGYPVENIEVEVVCVDHGLKTTDSYAGRTKTIDLALADLLLIIINKPNISEGGFSISLTDKKNLVNNRNQILSKHGLSADGPVITSPKVW